jgi:hypothetical protein
MTLRFTAKGENIKSIVCFKHGQMSGAEARMRLLGVLQADAVEMELLLEVREKLKLREKSRQIKTLCESLEDAD